MVVPMEMVKGVKLSPECFKLYYRYLEIQRTVQMVKMVMLMIKCGCGVAIIVA